MSSEEKAVNTAVEEKEDKALQYVHENRRYIGSKETFAYILHDFSESFNIGKYGNRFIWDVVKIDFQIAAFVNIFTGIWDVVNDIFIAAIVDRTRTRWGKFKPYVLFLKIPLALFGTLYWFMPFFFPNTGTDYMPKLIFYFAFGIIQETAGTFSGIAHGGLMSTITPHPMDRTRLITLANFWSGMVGEKIPELLMGLFIDLINNNKVRWKLRDLFVSMGILTSAVSTLASFYFIFLTRERVQQTIERPSIMQGIKAIINNKPILLITLSEFLSGFSVSVGRANYFIDVLGYASLQTIVGIPGGFASNTSYALIAPLRRRFSTKALWIGKDLYTDLCWLAVFTIGTYKQNFTKIKVMVPTLMIEEFIEMWAYGLRGIVGRELYNEAMDYCEWKNGYRAEATIGVARGLVTKLQRISMSSVQNLFMAKIGYEQGRKVGTQSMRTKWWIFALGTGFPIITGSLGIIPKFFYPLTGKRRDAMYADLLERRKQMAERVAAAGDDHEELARIAQAEIRGEYVQNRDVD